MQTSIFVIVCLGAIGSRIGVQGDIDVYDLKANTTVGDVIYDQPAGFGDDFPSSGLKGYLVIADPEDACQELKNESPEPTDYSWILLIRRGGPSGCHFSDKVLRAQRKNFDAVIVYDNKYESEKLQMSGGNNGSAVHIPSTFISRKDGELLAQYNSTSKRFILKIREPSVNLKMFLWPFVIVLGVCLIISIGFLLVKVAIDANRRQRSRLSSKHLKKIPIKKYKKGDYYDTCAICLDEYEDNEKIRVLPCDHVYHAKCIDPWLTKNKKTCPVCKRRVIPRRPQDSSDSESDAEARETTPLLRGATGGQPRGVSINHTAAELHQESGRAEGSESVATATDVPSEFLPQGSEPNSERRNPRRKRQRRRNGEGSQDSQVSAQVTGYDIVDEDEAASLVAAVAEGLQTRDERKETRDERKERKRKKKESKRKRRTDKKDEEEEEFVSAHSSFREDDRNITGSSERDEAKRGSKGGKRKGSQRKEKKSEDTLGGAVGETDEGTENLGFEESEEVSVASSSRSKKREMNEVV